DEPAKGLKQRRLGRRQDRVLAAGPVLLERRDEDARPGQDERPQVGCPDDHLPGDDRREEDRDGGHVVPDRAQPATRPPRPPDRRDAPRRAHPTAPSAIVRSADASPPPPSPAPGPDSPESRCRSASRTAV